MLFNISIFIEYTDGRVFNMDTSKNLSNYAYGYTSLSFCMHTCKGDSPEKLESMLGFLVLYCDCFVTIFFVAYAYI